jgi:hypothetical protein
MCSPDKLAYLRPDDQPIEPDEIRYPTPCGSKSGRRAPIDCWYPHKLALPTSA